MGCYTNQNLTHITAGWTKLRHDPRFNMMWANSIHLWCYPTFLSPKPRPFHRGPLNFRLPYCYKRRSERNDSCFKFHADYKLDVWKFHRTSLQHRCRHSYFSVVDSSAFEQERVFPPGKSCPSSAAPGAQRSAVPRYWPNGVIAGFLSNDETGDNLIVRYEDTVMLRQQVVRYVDCYRKE
jgi:hypothetical protein